MPAKGHAFALSPDGTRIAYFSNHRLEMVNVDSKAIVGSYGFGDYTEVSIMKWNDNNTLWFASSNGIGLWDMAAPDKTVLLVEYDDEFDYSQVVNFQMSQDNAWYMIHYKNDAVGFMQLGQVNGTFYNMMEGLAGQFFVSDSVYYKEPVVSYFFRKSGNAIKYYFKSDDLSNPSVQYMEPGTMDWDGGLKGNFATHMICDPKGSLCILTTNDGELQLWDVREGYILDQSDISFPVEDLLPCQDHFIGVKRDSTLLSLVQFDKEKALVSAFKRRHDPMIPLHVGCRYRMRDFTHPNLVELCGAHYKRNAIALISVIKKLSNNHISESGIMANPEMLIHTIDFLWNTRQQKHGIDWPAEVEWFATKYNALSIKTYPSPLPCTRRLTLEEVATFMGVEADEMAAMYIAQTILKDMKLIAKVMPVCQLYRQLDIGEMGDLGLDLILMAFDEEKERKMVKAFFMKLKEWEDGSLQLEEDTFEKLVADLKKQGKDEYSEEACKRLKILFSDPVARGIQRVLLRHQLKGESAEQARERAMHTMSDSASVSASNAEEVGENAVEVVMRELDEFAQLVPEHVIVKHIDVTELALQVMASDEQGYQYSMRTMAAMKSMEAFEQAKILTLMRHEMKRLEPLFPHLPLVLSCVKLEIEVGSPAFRALLDEMVGQDKTRRSEAEKVVKMLTGIE